MFFKHGARLKKWNTFLPIYTTKSWYLLLSRLRQIIPHISYLYTDHFLRQQMDLYDHIRIVTKNFHLYNSMISFKGPCTILKVEHMLLH